MRHTTTIESDQSSSAVMNMDLSTTATAGKPHSAPAAEPDSSMAGTLASLRAEIHQLRADLEQARAERARALDIQQRLMDLLGTKAPERIVHDVRNVMNERELFKALADTAE